MPGKPRRKKVKYSGQVRSKRPEKQDRPVAAARQREAAQVGESAAPARVPASRANTTAPAAKTAIIQYPFVAREMITIGILAGVMLVILIIVALILH